MVQIQDGTYAAAWHTYRRSSWWFWATLFSVFPAALLGALLTSVFGVGMLLPAALIWAAAVTITSYRATCPRCGQPYFRRGLYHNEFARQCLHCGLHKWAAEDPDLRGAHRDDDA